MQENIGAAPLENGPTLHVGITKPLPAPVEGPITHTHRQAAFYCMKQTASQQNHESHNISAELGPNLRQVYSRKIGADNCDP